MSGIVFMSTRMRDGIVDFYTSRMGMEVWLEQEDCTILRDGNLMVGFCQREKADTGGIITFVRESEGEVDATHVKLRDLAEEAPRENTKYRIYHFFLRDPEGRLLEVQSFLDRHG
jgi:catechol 2,3-dioxygenase-like lactoylglutathione lyase family enzyme